MNGKRIETCSYYYSEKLEKAECRKCGESKSFGEMRNNDYGRKLHPQAKKVIHICIQCDRIAKRMNDKVHHQRGLERDYERGSGDVFFCERGDYFRDKNGTRTKCRSCTRIERGYGAK